jgi:Acetyltransferases
MIEFRKANINDIEQLTNMRISMLCENNNFNEDYIKDLSISTSKYFLDGISNNSIYVLIAVEEQNIIAMSCLSYFKIPPNDWCITGKTAYLGNMYTIPMQRKRGIATKLLSMIINQGKADNCERIILNPTDSGKSIYEKYGFEPWSDAMALYPLK